MVHILFVLLHSFTELFPRVSAPARVLPLYMEHSFRPVNFARGRSRSMAEDEISVGYRFEATLEQSKHAYSRRMRRKVSMS